MSAPFVGEVRPWACNFAPSGWAFCAGQILPISQNTALFSLIGTYYGGNGTSNFQLPDLRGRVPMKYGTDPTGLQYVIGETAGEEQITLLSSQMPMHTHTFSGTTSPANKQVPSTTSSLATGVAPGTGAYYAPNTASLTQINIGTVSAYAGGNLPHSNIQPYQAINWCIALRGIYPARN